MKNLGLMAILLISCIQPAAAQSWVPWYQPGVTDLGSPPRYEEERSPPPSGRFPELMDGGARPSISPESPDRVSLSTSYAPGTIVIDTNARRLYLVQSRSSALMYPIAVGRVGFTWTGTEKISRIADWPDWHPPAEMRQRQPELPVKMTGGLRNPLGARALYLGNSLYRIHGTNSAQSIGRAGSSGCFRMMNSHVVDLARRVGVGTTVVVLNRLPQSARSARYD